MLPPTLNPGDGRQAVLLAHRFAGPFLITHKRYAPTFRQAWHEHPVTSIDFVLAGGGEGIYTRTPVQSRAGAVEFFRHEVRHRFTSSGSGIRSLHLLIPPELVDRPTLEVSVRELEPTRALGLAARLLAELNDPDASSSLAMESIAHELLAEASPAAAVRPRGTAGPRWLDRVRAALHDAPGPVGLAALADEAGVNPGHLARAFRARFGCSAGEYHRRVRLASAARRLAGTDEPIARIAQSEGFTDQAHLTRVFRAHTGATPAAFRRALGA